MGHMLVLEFTECFFSVFFLTDINMGSCSTWNYKVFHDPMRACVSCQKIDFSFLKISNNTQRKASKYFLYVAKLRSKSYLSSI